MSAVYTSVDQLIGKTPLLELAGLERELDLKARVLVKLERQNPAGSVKDRVALNMLNEAEAAGLIAPHDGYTIIEPTSGNTAWASPRWPPRVATAWSSPCRRP